MDSIWLNWLEELMRKKKVNNKGLAAQLAISPSTVGAWKKGQYKPDALSIIKLAELSDPHVDAPELFAMIYEQPLKNDRPARTLEEIVDAMPLADVMRMMVLMIEKTQAKIRDIQ